MSGWLSLCPGHLVHWTKVVCSYCKRSITSGFESCLRNCQENLCGRSQTSSWSCSRLEKDCSEPQKQIMKSATSHQCVQVKQIPQTSVGHKSFTNTRLMPSSCVITVMTSTSNFHYPWGKIQSTKLPWWNLIHTGFSFQPTEAPLTHAECVSAIFNIFSWQLHTLGMFGKAYCFDNNCKSICVGVRQCFAAQQDSLTGLPVLKRWSQ